MTVGTVAVVLLWAAVLAQFPSQRHVPIRRVVWYATLLLCAIWTLDQPQIGAALDRSLGLPNAADVAQHVLAVVAITLGRDCTVSIFGAWGPRGRPSAVRLAIPPATVIAAMMALFAVSPARTQPTDAARYTDFPMQFAAHPQVIAYWLVFVGYLAACFVIIARLAWRYARGIARTPVGQGLLLIAAGMVAGLGWAAYGTSEVAARAAGVSGPFITTAPVVIQVLFGALVLLVAAGVVLPAAQHWPGVRYAALYLSLRRLYPLWAGLCQAVPGIALNPVPVWADRLDPRDLRMRLYRRVIEIRDGYLALSPVDAPGIEDTVRAAAGRRRLSSADHAMIVAATRLELARRARLRGEVATASGPTTGPASRPADASGSAATAPADPTTPAAPEDATVPADAITPADATAPADAITPADATAPADPTAPADATAPADPTAPADASSPAGTSGHTDAYRAFLAGTDLDSEVRLLRTVAAHSATIAGAAERIERQTGRAVGTRAAPLPLDANHLAELNLVVGHGRVRAAVVRRVRRWWSRPGPA